jgi:hypothetical protein
MNASAPSDYADREYGVFDEIELEPYQRLSEGDQPADLRDLWAALRLLRETVRRELAPPAFVPNDEYLGPEPMPEAEVIVRGIHAVADSSRRLRR